MRCGLLLFLFVLKCLGGFAQSTEKTARYLTKGHQHIGNNKDSAYFYFNKAIAIAEKKDQTDYLLAGYEYLIYANGIYFDLRNFKNNLEKLETFITCDPQFESAAFKTYHQNKLLIEKGNYQYKLQNYEQAERYFMQVYQQLKSIPKEERSPYQIERIRSTLSFLPSIYRAKGKYQLAEDYYNTLLDFLTTHRNQLANPESSMALAQMYLAKLFQSQKKYQKAEPFIKKALSFYRHAGNAHKNSTISAYHLLVNNYLSQEKTDEAFSILKEIDEKNLIDPENLKFSIAQSQYKAQAFDQKENLETALHFYQEALTTTQTYYQTQHHPKLAELHQEIGELYAHRQEFEKSLLHFQKALSALSAGFQSKNFSKNPEPKTVLSKLSLVEILAAKQQALAAAFEHTANLSYLESAHETGKSFVKTLDAIKPEFEAKVDFQFLLEETFPAFDQMIETAFLLQQKTGQKSYWDDAFYFTEKSKAVLLLSVVQNTKADQFAGVPDSLVEKERHFRATIDHLEKKAFKNPNEKGLNNELFDIKNEFYAFLDRVKKEHPKYHQLKFSTEIAGLATIQQLLQPGEAILEYYIAADFLYCFLVQNEKTELFQIPLSADFFDHINRFRKLVSTPNVLKIEELKELGDKIGKKIIPKISPKVSSLIIVRSNVLNYLSFEALYQQNEQSYLLEDYTISYANSATLYREYASQNSHPNPKMMAFAPSFSATKNTEENTPALGQLLYNKKEAQQVSDYFEGEVLLNEQASLTAFANKAKTFGLLHLATHAIVNDQFPDYSYLAFSPRDSTHLLYVKDLYNYRLNADLAVLSACETGIGKLRKGTGMLSLAKGFNYAGVPSLVTTQWKIDDKSTAELMNGFYQNLAEGKAKNTALRNAKLQYLKAQEDEMLRHPYYWAGFVLSGNTDPVVGNPTWTWKLAGIVGLLLLVSAFLYWWKRKNEA